MTNEQWRPVPGWERYEVSNLGSVRAIARVDCRGNHTRQRILKARPNKGGYLQVRLYCDSGFRIFSVHLVVLSAFAGPRPEGMVGCHNNGDSFDNRSENLRWDTPSENARDRVAHGHDAQARKTHCIRGHELSGENLIPSNLKRGNRACLTRHRELGAQRRTERAA